MSYSTFQSGDGPGGGFPRIGEMCQPGDVPVSVSTDDIAGSLARAEALGGKTIVPRTEISPEFGAFAVFEDPAGNRMALHTMAPAR